MSRIATVLAAAVLAAAAVAAGAADDKPGAKDAIDAAIDKAVDLALTEAVGLLPDDVDTIALVPLDNDPDGVVTDRVQYMLVRKTKGRAKVVNRDDAGWKKLLEEFEFSEKRFDILADGEVRKFGKLLGADALLWGRVRDRGLDDSGIKGLASLTLYLGVVETGQIAGSGSGRATVTIEAETFLLGLIQKPWFWPAVAVAVVALVTAFLILRPIRRRLALATKPREIVR